MKLSSNLIHSANPTDNLVMLDVARPISERSLITAYCVVHVFRVIII